MLAAQSRMRLPAAVLAHALLPLAEGGEAAETLNEIEEYWLPLSRADSQYSGVLTLRSSASGSSRTPSRPGRSASAWSRGSGKDLVAKALKSAFFEAVLNSPKRVRRGGAAGAAGPYWDENITRAQPARKFNLGMLVNRLLHHCHIVNIRGKSYRIG